MHGALVAHIVPHFNEFLHHPALLASDKLLVGCDQEGKVASVRPSSFSQESGGVVLGSIEAKVKDKMALPVVATSPSEKNQGEEKSGDGAMGSSSSSSSVSDLMARLAARGVFAHKK